MEQVLRNYIPIEAHTNERIIREQIPVPEIGLRWGKAAAFEWSANARSSTPGGSYSLDDDTTKQEYIRVYVLSPIMTYKTVGRTLDNADRVIRIRRINTIQFSFIQQLSQRKNGRRIVRRTEVHLTCNLHPVSDDA